MMVLRDCDVKGISLELTTFCNLRCKLCAHNYDVAQKLIHRDTKPLSFWKSVIDRYDNLEVIVIAGILSEPTLYCNLKELIEYIKSKNIKIELYTNGNTHDVSYWKSLNNFLDINDKVVFTVCGSTQQLHEYYRVGSSLSQILENAAAFRESGKKNDWCQHILFEYNNDDFQKGNMNKIFSQFSHSFSINSLPYQERFNVSTDSDICMIKKLSCIYKYVMNQAKKNYQNQIKNNLFKIHCKNLDLNFLWIDSNGNTFPCFLYQLYSNNQFNNDYTDILSYKYDFCFECEEKSLKFLRKYNIEEMG